MPLKRFSPPANLDDVTGDALDQWSSVIKFFFTKAKHGNPKLKDHDSPRPQFYDPTETDTDSDAAERVISWTAFPQQVALTSASDQERWETADSSRFVQDEYCEWSVSRDGEGKITRVTFTCEGPEYWRFLSLAAPDKLLELYQTHIDPSVQKSDLFDGDQYVPENKWNSTTTDGAMHLIHGPNSLNAEIELAAGASIRRKIGGREYTEEQELIVCGDYGEPSRNSDPHIGGEVNALARQRADVTLKDPVGLYIDGLDTALFQTPDGSDPQSYWKIVRGDEEHAVRAVYEVPDGNFAVGDIAIDGVPIEYGAQIVDHIKIKLTGVACRFGKSSAEPMTACAVRRRIAGRAFAHAPEGPPELEGYVLASRLG